MIDKEKVREVLKEVIDPEIGINIVDLGLVYDIQIIEDTVYVKMTLTVPGCPLGNFILTQAKEKIEGLEGVKEANIELVWDPPWNISMVSEEAKKKLGIA